MGYRVEFRQWMYDRGDTAATVVSYTQAVGQVNVWLYEHRGMTVAYAVTADLQGYLLATNHTSGRKNVLRTALVAFYDWRGGSLNPAVALVRAKPTPATQQPLFTEDLRPVREVG